jgi:hypothetical protein
MVLANIAWLRMIASAMQAPENNINAMPNIVDRVMDRK